MRARDDIFTVGVFIYDGVEPIDVGATTGVMSMARRVLPNLKDFVVASRAGPVKLAGGLTVLAHHGVTDAPPCDLVVVCGGPGWRDASKDAATLAYLTRAGHAKVASVCTGAMILGAAGLLDGHAATTRRMASGSESQAPLALLATIARNARLCEAVVVDDGIVTGGGVSLAIDAMLYLLERAYGAEAVNEVARIIEYDRARAANASAFPTSLPMTRAENAYSDDRIGR